MDDAGFAHRGSVGLGSPAFEPTKLRHHVGTGATLTTAFADRLLQQMQRSKHCLTIRFQTAAFEFVDPVRRCAVTALAIAAGAGRHLVLEPGGATLDPGNEVFGCGEHLVGIDLSSTPHTASAISLEDQPHAGAARQVAITRGIGVAIGRRRSGHGRLLRLGHRPRPGESIGGGDPSLGCEVAGERRGKAL